MCELSKSNMTSSAVLILVIIAAGISADAYQAPTWACSPAPRFRNPLCPAPADGDSRCSRISCPADAGCATENCNAVQGQIKADQTLVRDAWFQRGTTCIKTTWTLSECCALCSSTEGCNAWSYCNNPEGCGDDCVAADHNFNLARGMNIFNMNPLNHPARLNPERRCTRAGRWPYNTCSLKVVADDVDVTSPPLVANSEGSGWVSGVLSSKGTAAPLATDIPAASADNLNVWEEYQKAVEQQIGTYLPEEELQQFEQQQQPEGSDTIAADPVAVYEAIEQQQPEDSNIDMVAADEQHVDDAFQLIDTQPGPTQPDQQQQQPSDQAAQQVDQQQAFEQQQQLLQPELVDQVELDSTVADVLASNPQSRTTPQGPAAVSLLNPDATFESAASTLESPLKSPSDGSIAVAEGQTRPIREVRSATRNSAQGVGNSGAVMMAAAVGAVVLLSSLRV